MEHLPNASRRRWRAEGMATALDTMMGSRCPDVKEIDSQAQASIYKLGGFEEITRPP